MRYLYLDINLAIKKLEYREGLVSNCEPICILIDKLKSYKKKLNNLMPNDKVGFTKICRNFDSFIKRHGIQY